MLAYIAGGQRSGKIRYAQGLARLPGPNPVCVCLATLRAWDDKRRQRVARHMDSTATPGSVQIGGTLQRHRQNRQGPATFLTT